MWMCNKNLIKAKIADNPKFGRKNRHFPANKDSLYV